MRTLFFVFIAHKQQLKHEVKMQGLLWKSDFTYLIIYCQKTFAVSYLWATYFLVFVFSLSFFNLTLELIRDCNEIEGRCTDFCLMFHEPDLSKLRFTQGAPTSQASNLMFTTIFYSNNIPKIVWLFFFNCVISFFIQLHHTKPYSHRDTQ